MRELKRNAPPWTSIIHSPTESWREPRRLQIPVWLYDTQLAHLHTQHPAVKDNAIHRCALMDPYWSALGFTLIETCLSAAVNSYPMYCSGWLWWMTIRQVGHVLFSSRYFTKQLLQTIYNLNTVNQLIMHHYSDFRDTGMSQWRELINSLLNKLNDSVQT